MPRWDVPSDCLRMPPRPRPRPRRPPPRPPPVDTARSIRGRRFGVRSGSARGGRGVRGGCQIRDAPKKQQREVLHECARRGGRLLARTSASATASAISVGHDLRSGLVGGRVGSGARAKRRAGGEPCAASRQRLRRGDHVASTQRSCERRHGEARFRAARMRSEMSGCCCDAFVEPPRSSRASRSARDCARAGAHGCHLPRSTALGFVAAAFARESENWARFEPATRGCPP